MIHRFIFCLFILSRYCFSQWVTELPTTTEVKNQDDSLKHHTPKSIRSQISIWADGGVIVSTSGIGFSGGLQVANQKGLLGGIRTIKAEKPCVFCNYGNESLDAIGLMFGYSTVVSNVIYAQSVGPVFGKGVEFPEEFKQSVCPVFDFGGSCVDPLIPEHSNYRGIGFILNWQTGFVGRVSGLALDFSLLHLDEHTQFGVALVIPVGKMY